MENTLNKLKNLTINIINSKKHLINIIFNTLNTLNLIHFEYGRNKLEKYYFELSQINFTELNSYCEYGYNISDSYIVYEYINKNRRYYEQILKLYSINDEDDEYEDELFEDEEMMNFKDNIMYYILFLTDEELYNKLFKDIFKVSRKEMFDFCIKYFSDDYFKNEKINYEKFMNNTKLRDINFYKGDLFLRFRDIFYYIIYDSKYKRKTKLFLLDYLLDIFKIILISIINITFLPLNIMLNNYYNEIKFEENIKFIFRTNNLDLPFLTIYRNNRYHRYHFESFYNNNDEKQFYKEFIQEISLVIRRGELNIDEDENDIIDEDDIYYYHNTFRVNPY